MQDAKNHFSEVVRRAMRDGPQTTTRYGREEVVVVATAEYQRVTRSKGSLVTFSRDSPLKGVNLNVERA